MERSDVVSSEPLGLESGRVRVVPYDDRWPRLFAAEATRISDAVVAGGLKELRLEHIGSTAVAGLSAKPILDIAAGFAAGEVPAAYVDVLESLGYVHRGNAGLPGREFFRRGEPRSHHIHLVERDDAHWVAYLRFRDVLRADALTSEVYAALKHALSIRHSQNREAYSLGKAEFIERILRAEGPGRRP